MAKAILMTYAVDQNCPSKPVPKVFDLPDDKKDRDAFLIARFFEFALSDEDPDVIDGIEIIDEPNEFGDITVAEESGVYLYVTFIEAPQDTVRFEAEQQRAWSGIPEYDVATHHANGFPMTEESFKAKRAESIDN